MLSSKSLVGLVIIVIVTVLLVHLKTSSKGPDDNRFILKAPDDYDTFVESIEEYRYYECLDNFANEISDQIVKETIIKHKDSILSIIYINIYTYARNRKYSLEPVEVSHAESIKHYFESFFSEPNPSIDKLLFKMNNISLEDFELGYLPVEALSLFPNITLISLSKTKLKTGFEALEILKKLQHIFLDENGIEEFPNFSEFPNLEEVSLSKNRIAKISLDSYKKSDGSGYISLPITLIHLDENQIETIDDNFHEVFPNLGVLNLKANRLQERPKFLDSYNTEEVTIDCEDNPFLNK